MSRSRIRRAPGLVLVVLSLSGCWLTTPSNDCGGVTAHREHTVTSMQRAALVITDGAIETASCRRTCDALEPRRSGLPVRCALGSGDAGEVFACDYLRICR